MKKLLRKTEYLGLCLLLLALYGVVVLTLVYFTIHWSITIFGVLLSSIGYVFTIEKLNAYFGTVIDRNEGFDDQ